MLDSPLTCFGPSQSIKTSPFPLPFLFFSFLTLYIIRISTLLPSPSSHTSTFIFFPVKSITILPKMKFSQSIIAVAVAAGIVNAAPLEKRAVTDGM